MDVAVVGTGYPEIISLLNDFISVDTKLNFIGFLDDNQNNKSRNLYGYEIVGPLEWVTKRKNLLVVNSIFRSPFLREKITKKLEAFEAKFLTLIHPTVSCEFAKVAAGSIIGRNCVLEPGSFVGKQSVILHNSVISHGSQLGMFNFIGNNVTIQGDNFIGDYVSIAAGTSTSPQIKINNNAVIGLNSIVTQEVCANSTIASPPSRILKI